MAKQPKLDDYGDMLSLPDVAEILGVHITTVRRYAREGTIPCHRLPGGRRYYVLKDELVDWIRSQPANPDEQQDAATSEESASDETRADS